MHLRQLMGYKGMPDVRRSLLDFMGKRELAANLFRLSETEERSKMSLAQGQRPAEKNRVAR
jgi:DNA-damage-inducible protein D